MAPGQWAQVQWYAKNRMAAVRSKLGGGNPAHITLSDVSENTTKDMLAFNNQKDKAYQAKTALVCIDQRSISAHVLVRWCCPGAALVLFLCPPCRYLVPHRSGTFAVPKLKRNQSVTKD